MTIMKSILYNLKFTAVVVLTLSFMTSCDALLDDDVTDFGTGPNFVGFEEGSIDVNVGEGSGNNDAVIPLVVIGPTSEFMNETVTVTWSVDPSSTAEAGVHYELPSSSGTVELTSENDYYYEIPLTVITDDLLAPNEETLVLTVTEFSTNDKNVVINEKTEQVIVNLNVLCHEELAGEYIHPESGLTVNIEELGIARFKADNLAPFTAVGYPQASFVFTMDCERNITIVDFPDFTNTMEGAGTVNDDGTITFTDMSISGIGSIPDFTIELK